jgi:ABC-type sulfate transport system permease subunit
MRLNLVALPLIVVMGAALAWFIASRHGRGAAA